MYWTIAIVVAVVLAAVGIFFWPEKKYKTQKWMD